MEEAQALNNSVVQGELAILQSNAVIARVARGLDLLSDPEFNPELRPPSGGPGLATQAKDFIKSFLPLPESKPVQFSAAKEEGEEDTRTPVELAADRLWANLWAK